MSTTASGFGGGKATTTATTKTDTTRTEATASGEIGIIGNSRQDRRGHNCTCGNSGSS